ncbi:MAG: hypothetical protein P1P64_03840 [Treponemataceae bacterium]
MKKMFFASFLFFLSFEFFAEPINFQSYNFIIDLPEGFYLADSNQKDRYLFSSTILPCELQISFDVKSRFKTIKNAAESIFSQLKAGHKEIEFFWCEKKALFSTMDFGQNFEYTGSVLVLELKDVWLTLTAYSKASDATLCEPMLISAFDSVFTTSGSFYVPGPITSCLFKRETNVAKTINFHDESLNFFVDKLDAQANKSVIDREFKLLTHYLNTQYVISAWERYYRNIFRDAWQRLESFSFAVKNYLYSKNLLADKIAVSKTLMSYTQKFTYHRDPQGSDFVNLVSAVEDGIGDCDTRSLLLNIVLAQLGIKSVSFISPEFSHAICGIAVDGKGAKFLYAGENYLLAETTAKVGLGQIAADHADSSKWFAVEFYNLPK